MYWSAGSPSTTGECFDISFAQSRSWGVSELDQDMRTLAFGVGDDICGPMVTLVSITVGPGDEEKFPPIIHMHRSDSFRTIFNGDLLVGRKSYADGAARLQASGAYYGPEQPGPDSVRSSSEI